MLLHVCEHAVARILLHIGAGVSTTVRHLHDLNNKRHKTENLLSNAIRAPRISNACNRYWQHELSWKWNLFTGFWCPMLCFGAAPLPTWRTAASLSPWREGDVLFTAPKVLGWQSYHLYWRPEVWCFQPAPSCFVEKSRGCRSSTTVTASWRKKCTSTTRIYLIQYLHVNSYYSGRCEYSKKSTISRNTLRSTLPPVVLGWMFWTSENWSAFLKGDWICIYWHSMFSKKDTPQNLIFSICRNAQPASGMRHRAGTKHNFLRKSDLSTCSHPWSSMHHKQPYDFHIHAWSITAVYYDRFALHWNLSHGFTCDILIKAASFPSFFWRPLIGIFIFKGNGWDLHDPLRYDLLHIDFLESFHCLSEKSFTWSHQDLWDGKEFNAHS